MRKLNYLSPCSTGALRFCFFAFCMFSGILLNAQLLRDGSFEGSRSNLPYSEGWTDCNGTPDTQVLDGFGVGIFGIRTPASHGEQYLGLLADDAGFSESIGQAFFLEGGQLYTGNIDIYRSVVHNSWNGTGRIEIWAGSNCGNAQELIWNSGTISNEDYWQNYTVALLPRQSYNWITVKAVLDAGSGEMTYLCIDNFDLLSSALGFDFVDFSANAVGKQVSLAWETEALTETHDFSVQWSADGQSFTEIGNQIGLVGEGNFQFVWNAQFSGKHFFRIAATDLRGNLQISEVVEANIAEDDGGDMVLYPNPARAYLQIALPENNAQADICQLRIYDAQGRLVLTQNRQHQANLRLQLPAYLPQGMYFLESQVGQLVARKSFLIQK